MTIDQAAALNLAAWVRGRVYVYHDKSYMIAGLQMLR